ncbi:MAG: hypothetical protein AAGB16_09125 [Pseudomonadota bacterium]
MWITLAKSMSNASAKLIATFFMVLALMLLAFAFFPAAINELRELIQQFLLTDFMRDPPLSEQGELLFDMLINEASIFGIIMTLIARMLVEILFWGTVRLWRLVNPADEPEPAPQDVQPEGYYQ